jgi:hypothetical protein
MGYHIDPGAVWASSINTGLVLGGAGAGSSGNYWLIAPNTSGGPEPYRLVLHSNPVTRGGPDLSTRAQCENCLVTDGTDFYLHGGFFLTFDGVWHFHKDLWKYTVATDTWTQLADAPDAHYTTMATYDTDRNEIVVWDHDPGAIGVVYAWDRGTNTWFDRTPPAGVPGILNQAGVYAPTVKSHLYIGGVMSDPNNNNDVTFRANPNVKVINIHVPSGGVEYSPPVTLPAPPPPPPPASLPVPSTLGSVFVGRDQDNVGPINQTSPNGIADFHISVSGLRSIPVTVRVTSDTGGVWETPFNGTNWIIATQFQGSAGDLWFEPFGSNRFHVKVMYADGSTDETDAVGAAPPVSTLQAAFVGRDQDRVGQINQATPNGVSDFHISVSGLRSTPVTVTVTSDTGGVWETPFNGTNWIIATQFQGNAGDVWFEPFDSNRFHVKVTYADGSTDETDALNTPSQSSSLQGLYLGRDRDNVGQINQATPNGVSDFHISVSGLRSIPVTVRVISDTGGVWETPFNGTNWIIATQYQGSAGDLWFEPFASNLFHVLVTYSDNSTDEALVAGGF